jgi:adenylate cyclase, class 2
LGTETEIKIKIEDPEAFCLNLQDHITEVLSARHFEDNCILDFSDGRLQVSRSMIRIREADGKGYLTFKGPPQPEGIFKIREELETRVEMSGIALQILERLGMRICFRYQKYRREFAAGNVVVAIDETPIGSYVEFEGSEADIIALARNLEIPSLQFLRSSYYSLYLEYCEKSGETPNSMTF